MSHEVSCLRNASRIMGVELFSGDRFVRDAIGFLCAKGVLTIEGSDQDGWSVLLDEGGAKVTSGGGNLLEALCGAVHCFDTDGGAHASPYDEFRKELGLGD